MTLSDLTVRQAKAAEKTYSIPDTDGLGLVVARTGGKSWHLRYYWLGKQKRISLGNYPEIGLREARTLRDEARALLAKGVNPHTDRKQKRHAVKLAADYTFKAVFDAWVEHRRKEIKEGRNSTLSQILRIFNKDVLPRACHRIMRMLRYQEHESQIRPDRQPMGSNQRPAARQGRTCRSPRQGQQAVRRCSALSLSSRYPLARPA